MIRRGTERERQRVEERGYRCGRERQRETRMGERQEYVREKERDERERERRVREKARQGWERERLEEIQGGREKDRTRDRGGRERQT